MLLCPLLRWVYALTAVSLLGILGPVPLAQAEAGEFLADGTQVAIGEAAAHDIDLTSDEKYAFVSVPFTGKIRKVDLENRTIVQSWTIGSSPKGIDLSEDESTLYIALGATGTVGVLDLVSGTLSLIDVSVELGRNAFDVVQPAIGLLFVSGYSSEPGYLVRVDLSTNAKTRVANDLFLNSPSWWYGGPSGEVYVRSDDHLYRLDEAEPDAPIIDSVSLPTVSNASVAPDGSHFLLNDGTIVTSDLEVTDSFDETGNAVGHSADSSTAYFVDIGESPRTHYFIAAYDVATQAQTGYILVRGCSMGGGSNPSRLVTFAGGFVSMVDGRLCVIGTPFAPQPRTCNVDGDEYGDAIVDVGYENIGARQDAGMFHLVRGSLFGLTVDQDQPLHQNSDGVPGASEAFDYFGWVSACADFDGDGFDDVVVGAPGEGLGSVEDAGVVYLFSGGASGLTPEAQVVSQDSAGVGGTAEVGDLFGWSLAAGDFDGDGHLDLVVSSPLEDVGGVADAGIITVFYGSADGLDLADDLIIHQDTPGIPGIAESGDGFGSVLGVGDFDGDGHSDLAVGTPLEDIGAIIDAGDARIIYGSATGLKPSGAQSVHQDLDKIPGTAEANDLMGDALGAGDLNGDGFDELVVGVPYEDISDITDVGLVVIIDGSANGLALPTATNLHRGSPGILGVNDSDTAPKFGVTVAVGDFDASGSDDLATMAPVNLHVIYSAPGVGLTQNDTFISSTDAPFGSVFVVDSNSDGIDDLLWGGATKPAEVGGFGERHGSPTGLVSAGSFSQDSFPGSLTGESGDRYGLFGGSQPL